MHYQTAEAVAVSYRGGEGYYVLPWGCIVVCEKKNANLLMNSGIQEGDTIDILRHFAKPLRGVVFVKFRYDTGEAVFKRSEQ